MRWLLHHYGEAEHGRPHKHEGLWQSLGFDAWQRSLRPLIGESPRMHVAEPAHSAAQKGKFGFEARIGFHLDSFQ